LPLFQPTTNHYSIQRFRSAAAALIGSIRHADLLIHPLLSRQPRVSLQTREYLVECIARGKSIPFTETVSEILEFGNHAEPFVCENGESGQYRHLVINNTKTLPPPMSSEVNGGTSEKSIHSSLVPSSSSSSVPLPIRASPPVGHVEQNDRQVDLGHGVPESEEEDDLGFIPGVEVDEELDAFIPGPSDDEEEVEEEEEEEGNDQMANDQGELLQQYTDLLLQQTQVLAGSPVDSFADMFSSIAGLPKSTPLIDIPKHFGYRHITCWVDPKSKRSSLIPKILPSSFQAITCHPVRRTLALLLTQGRINLAVDFRKDAFAHASTIQSDTYLHLVRHYDKWGTLVGAFLRQGTSATDESPMVSSPILAPYGPFMAKRIPATFFGDPRGAIRQEYETISLYEANPCHLLLLSCSVAHSPEELLHYACLFLSVACVQCGITLFELQKYHRVDDIGQQSTANGATSDIASPIGSILIPYVRFARLLLSLSIDPQVCGGIDALALAFDSYLSEVGEKLMIEIPQFVKPQSVDQKLELTSTATNNDAIFLAVKTFNSSLLAFPQQLSSDEMTRVMFLSANALKFIGSTGSSSSSKTLQLSRSIQLPQISLIDLPETFDSLYTSLMSFECKHCKKRPDNLMLCLICGELLCATGDCCRSCAQRGGSTSFYPTAESTGQATSGRRSGIGEATRHAILCGGGIGVQLSITSNAPYATVVWLFRGEFCVNYSGIYLDARGEEDIGFRRGRTLTLDKSRYKALCLLYSRGLVGRQVLSSRLKNSQHYIGSFRDSIM
jgi:hypothetical protein